MCLDHCWANILKIRSGRDSRIENMYFFSKYFFPLLISILFFYLMSFVPFFLFFFFLNLAMVQGLL
jgi:hypothetical protein